MPDDARSELMPVFVFDLDGTILRCNSFPLWARFLVLGRLPGAAPRARLLLAWRAARLLGFRKFGRLHHAALLCGLVEAWRGIATVAQRDIITMTKGFHATLRRRVRPGLAPLLDRVAAGQVDAILATAAAADYAVPFGTALGFRHVEASWPEHGQLNVGIRKRDQVLALLDRRGWRARAIILLTDHIDDLPLMRESRLVCWFGPSHLMRAACDAAPGARFVFCRDMDAGELLATVAVDDQQRAA